jgi:hypothetical protein
MVVVFQWSKTGMEGKDKAPMHTMKAYRGVEV